MLNVYTLNEAKRWDAIVRSFPDYDVYWLNGYVKAFQVHGDGEPMLLFYDAGSTRGINVVMKRDIAKAAPFRDAIKEDSYYDITTPYGYGGWLIEGKNINNLFRSYFDWLNENNVVSEFARFHPVIKNHEACQSFYEIDQLGEVVCMDLSSPDVIWNNLTRENRNRIRKAIKNGVQVNNGNSSEIYEQFRRIYNTTMDRNNAEDYYYFDQAFYQSVLKELSQNSRVFWAEKDGEIIAASIMIYANGHMNFHLSGSLEEYNCLAPNNLIMYNAALWGYGNGYRILLLGGGVGSKEDTLLRYKKTFYKGGGNHFFIGKKVINQEKYDYLVNLRNPDESQFFPQYRSPTAKWEADQ